jgi:hypothetical protein
VDRGLLKSVLELFVVMGVCIKKHDFRNREDVERATKNEEAADTEVYTRNFEAGMLRSARAYYEARAAAWISEKTAPEYLRVAEAALAAEEARVAAYMHVNTWPKLREVRARRWWR